MTGDNEPEDDGLIECWCGESGPAYRIFDDAFLDDTCGGTGTLYCHCGGDQCCCHHHGETDCPGCEDCRDFDDDDGQEWGYDE